MIITNLKYIPLASEVKNEEDILNIIEEVRKEISYVSQTFKGSLTETLKIIEKGTYALSEGKYNGDRHTNVEVTQIDLTEAKNLVLFYRNGSEEGCKSCKHKEGISNPTAYIGDRCNIHKEEGEERIFEHYETNCNEWHPKFPKTIENILKCQEPIAHTELKQG